jgi:hypothetical protein
VFIRRVTFQAAKVRGGLIRQFENQRFSDCGKACWKPVYYYPEIQFKEEYLLLFE